MSGSTACSDSAQSRDIQHSSGTDHNSAEAAALESLLDAQSKVEAAVSQAQLESENQRMQSNTMSKASKSKARSKSSKSKANIKREAAGAGSFPSESRILGVKIRVPSDVPKKYTAIMNPIDLCRSYLMAKQQDQEATGDSTQDSLALLNRLPTEAADCPYLICKRCFVKPEDSATALLRALQCGTSKAPGLMKLSARKNRGGQVTEYFARAEYLTTHADKHANMELSVSVNPADPSTPKVKEKRGRSVKSRSSGNDGSPCNTPSGNTVFTSRLGVPVRIPASCISQLYKYYHVIEDSKRACEENFVGDSKQLQQMDEEALDCPFMACKACFTNLKDCLPGIIKALQCGVAKTSGIFRFSKHKKEYNRVTNYFPRMQYLETHIANCPKFVGDRPKKLVISPRGINGNPVSNSSALFQASDALSGDSQSKKKRGRGATQTDKSSKRNARASAVLGPQAAKILEESLRLKPGVGAARTAANGMRICVHKTNVLDKYHFLHDPYSIFGSAMKQPKSKSAAKAGGGDCTNTEDKTQFAVLAAPIYICKVCFPDLTQAVVRIMERLSEGRTGTCIPGIFRWQLKLSKHMYYSPVQSVLDKHITSHYPTYPPIQSREISSKATKPTKLPTTFGNEQALPNQAAQSDIEEQQLKQNEAAQLLQGSLATVGAYVTNVAAALQSGRIDVSSAGHIVQSLAIAHPVAFFMHPQATAMYMALQATATAEGQAYTQAAVQLQQQQQGIQPTMPETPTAVEEGIVQKRSRHVEQAEDEQSPSPKKSKNNDAEAALLSLMSGATE